MQQLGDQKVVAVDSSSIHSSAPTSTSGSRTNTVPQLSRSRRACNIAWLQQQRDGFHARRAQQHAKQRDQATLVQHQRALDMQARRRAAEQVHAQEQARLLDGLQRERCALQHRRAYRKTELLSGWTMPLCDVADVSYAPRQAFLRRQTLLRQSRRTKNEQPGVFVREE